MVSPCRRRWAAGAAAAAALAVIGRSGKAQRAAGTAPLRVCTFGDSVLDCARYNERGIDPGRLIVRNDDALFPEFKGRDLSSRGPARLEHRAVDGATVDGLGAQARGLERVEPSIALVTIGGNDLLRGLAADDGRGIARFETTLATFLRDLPVGRVLLGTVYDPTFGDDARNFLGVPAAVARANHRRVNDVIRRLAPSRGAVVDIHAHFLAGDPSWYTRTIEPSLVGASEIRRVFLAAM